MEAIVILALIGFLLLAAEVFVPGMILGLLGAACLIVAITLGYSTYGPGGGTAILALLSVLTLAAFITWMFAFPRTSIGRRITLARSLPRGEDKPPASPLLGKEGVAVTPLRPAGTALINGARADVVTDGTFIDAGEPVLVAAVEGSRVVVRKAAAIRRGDA